MTKLQTSKKFYLYSFNKESIMFVEPIYVGFCVSEISKIIIYEWYYDEIQPCFGEHILELQYVDTD